MVSVGATTPLWAMFAAAPLVDDPYPPGVVSLPDLLWFHWSHAVAFSLVVNAGLVFAGYVAGCVFQWLLEPR